MLIDNFDEICPAGGVIRYEGGEIKCSVHEDGNKSDEDESPGDEVPWLWEKLFHTESIEM